MIHRRLLPPAALIAFLALGGCADRDRSAEGAPPADTTGIGDEGAEAPPARGSSGIPAFLGDDTLPVTDSPAAPPDSIHSLYSSLEEADCRLVQRDEESGSTTVRCPGIAGYALLVDDFDARMSVNVVAPDGRTHRLQYTSSISSAFSSLGPRAEWRMRGETPYALIVRVNAFEHPETPDVPTSYLAVAKIGGDESCVTDRILPTANANEVARRAADSSATRPCRWRRP